MNPILMMLIALIVLIIVFLIARELVCWYWKINESLEVLKEIRDLLAAQQKGNQRSLSPAEKEEKARKKALREVDESELERQAMAAKNPDQE